MALDLQNTKLLGYSHKSEFIPGDLFRIGCRKNLTIETSLYDLSNSVGVSGVLTSLSGFLASGSDYQQTTINGTAWGLSRIDNISFGESNSNDVRQKPVTINLTIFDSGNTFNLDTGSNYYSGIDFNNVLHPGKLIEDLSETFNFNINNDNSYSYSHSAKVKMVSGAAAGTNANPIDMGKNLIGMLFSSSPNFGFINSQYSGFYNHRGKTTYTESVNQITNEVSATKNFKLISISGSGNYRFIYETNLTQDEQGLVNITEKGKSEGLTSPYFDNALFGANVEVTNSFNRCNGVFNYYAPSGSYPLNSTKQNFSLTLNKVLDTVDYSVSYTNNPANNNTYTWTQTTAIERSDNACLYKITENGEIFGYSTNCTPGQKYNNANNGYSTVSAGIASRISNFYNSTTNLSNSLALIEKQEARNKLNGTIKYSQTYTDDLLYNNAGMKKVEYTIEDSYPVPLVNKFNIVDVDELVQPANIPTLGKRNLNIEIIGTRGTALETYLTYVKNNYNATFNAIPAGGGISDVYISNCEYGLQPFTNKFNVSVEWSYVGNINIGDINQFLIS